jgi:hypothetical protein
LKLAAYRRQPNALSLRPADRDRKWMVNTIGGNALRCLPMMIANEAGWTLHLRHTVHAQRVDDVVEVEADKGAPVGTAFGNGILTFYPGWFFRTPPGWNLLVRGPANYPKDGASPLEGMVEADWAVSTFTCNWLIFGNVTWTPDEPIAMVVPMRRGELNQWEPEQLAAEDNPELMAEVDAWSFQRTSFDLDKERDTAHEMDYWKGHTPDGKPAPGHQQRLTLRGWRKR